MQNQILVIVVLHFNAQDNHIKDGIQYGCKVTLAKMIFKLILQTQKYNISSCATVWYAEPILALFFEF